MVGVAQLVEPRFVVPVVVGSSPIAHPISLFNDSQPGRFQPGDSSPGTAAGSVPCRECALPGVRRGEGHCDDQPLQSRSMQSGDNHVKGCVVEKCCIGKPFQVRSKQSWSGWRRAKSL